MTTEVPEDDEPSLTAFLEKLRAIEAWTPYRLRRNSKSGAWYFAMPRIYAAPIQ